MEASGVIITSKVGGTHSGTGHREVDGRGYGLMATSGRVVGAGDAVAWLAVPARWLAC